ncbi:MAG: hypothetical protein CMJ83_08070 [Planctomycetes bacterium]|nr:hypothetical protein [Planctomycetota bacterium]
MNGLIASYRAAFAGLPRAAWILAVVAFVNRAGTMVVGFLTLWLTKERGFDDATAGVLLSVYGAGAFVGTWLGGYLTDRIGALPVQTASFASVGVGFLVMGNLHGELVLTITCFVVAVLGESFRPANATLIAQTCDAETRTKAYALHRLAINLGMAISPVVGGQLAKRSYDFLFLVDGGTCLAAALLFWLAFRHFAGARVSKPADDEDPGAARGPWSDRRFLVCLIASSGLAMVFFQMFATLPLFLNVEWGLDEGMIGLVFAVNPVLIVLFEMVLVERLRGRHPLRIVAAGAAFVAIGFGMFSWGHGFWWGVVAIIVFTIGEMLDAPFFSGYIANRANDRNRGRYMAAFGLSHSVGFMLGPAIGTAVYATFNATVLWTGCLVIGLLSAGLFWLVSLRA